MSEYIRDTEASGKIIYESGGLSMVEVVGFPDDDPTEEPDDIPEVLPLNDSATFSAPIALTPENEAAIRKAGELYGKLYETVKAMLDRVAEAFRPLWEAACETFGQAKLALTKNANNVLDAMLYAANDNPKWWHLYKHAKKHRTRKKYRDKLMRQLVRKLSNAKQVRE